MKRSETNFDLMLGFAKEILNLNKEYYLCGSIPLMLSGAIPFRHVNDLDFIVHKDRFNVDKLQLDDREDYAISEYDGYVCYKTTGDKKGWYYNVFVHEDSSKIRVTDVEGIRCQKIAQILFYKNEFNREKDINDLKPKEPLDFIKE